MGANICRERSTGLLKLTENDFWEYNKSVPCNIIMQGTLLNDKEYRTHVCVCFKKLDT